jgi:hypothetical protein
MPTNLLYTAIGMKNYHPLSSSDRAGVLTLNMQPPESALRCQSFEAISATSFLLSSSLFSSASSVFGKLKRGGL